MAVPQIESFTPSGANSANTSPPVAYPAYENGDLLISYLYSVGNS